MSDYEDSGRKSDYEMASSGNDDEDEDDDDNDGEHDDDNTDNDNIDGEDEGNSGGGGCGDNDEDDLEPPSKRAMFDSMSQYNSDEHTGNETSSTEGTKSAEYDWSSSHVVSKIMSKMGHKPGTGLGKHGQGIIEPVAASDQIGKRGLGYRLDESVLQRKADPEVERISSREYPVWLENTYPPSEMPDMNDFKEWMKLGPEKLSIEDEYQFCKPKVLQGILKAKEKLDDIEDSKKTKSRCRSNPFEAIKGGIFLNRAAMKMANMDSVFDSMFTNPKDQNGKEVIGPNDLLYFADVCAGPGGFSEYVFFRKKWRAKGFGFTLRESNDFKLDDFFAGPSETFEPHYGVPIDDGLGDGDIFKPENITEFSSYVMENTDGKGVHFMMADGGFSLEKKSLQEIISKQLYLCQCLVALKIVRDNGNFVVKLFDLFTPFSVGLVYLMYRCFDRICIHKPNSSRPANSERYLICQYKRSNCADIIDYLFTVNELLCEREMRKEDVLELVSVPFLKQEEKFYNYIVESNNSLGKRQTWHLQNIVKYTKLSDKSDERQNQLKEECLKLWNVPNEARTNPCKGDATSVIESLFPDGDTKFLNEKPSEIDKTFLESNPESFKGWHWGVVESQKASESLTFYLGLGKGNVYRYLGGKWTKFTSLSNFQLPAGTLVYGETVRENILGPDLVKVRYHVYAFHIVDGLFLGYENIQNNMLHHRKKCCEMFAKALSRKNMIYRVKELEMMETNPYCELSLSLSKFLKPRTSKARKTVMGYDVEKDRFIVPGGLFFLPEAKDTCQLLESTSRKGQLYYHNNITNCTEWRILLLKDSMNTNGKEIKSIHRDIISNFKNSFQKRRILWLNEEDLREFGTFEKIQIKPGQND